MKKYKVAVVGVGAVGTEMVRLLIKRKFPFDSLTILARTEREEVIDGISYLVKKTTPEAFGGINFAFFAGTEGEKGASQLFGWEAVKRGCIVIDNGDDFRMDSRVPLVIPEINLGALKNHKGFIANPNCSTIIALIPLAPLHKLVGIKRIVASTYQAVSGTGAPAVKELEMQARAWANGCSMPPRTVYLHQIAFNVIPCVGSFRDDSGESTEEQKMRNEARKIFGNSALRISTTCVRVPVFNGHSVAINVELKELITPDEARMILRSAPGVKVVDDPRGNIYPMPINASGEYDVLVGRIRNDPSVENGLALWCSGDNIWKGAAQNAIQIAECLLNK
jgi:aspartate-semialdehyde dehydrogenase